MTFNAATRGGRALGFFIVPPLEKGVLLSPLWKRDVLSSLRWKTGAHFPPFSTTLFVIEPPDMERGIVRSVAGFLDNS
jgi:hypothetical protein